MQNHCVQKNSHRMKSFEQVSITSTMNTTHQSMSQYYQYSMLKLLKTPIHGHRQSWTQLPTIVSSPTLQPKFQSTHHKEDILEKMKIFSPRLSKQMMILPTQTTPKAERQMVRQTHNRKLKIDRSTFIAKIHKYKELVQQGIRDINIISLTDRIQRMIQQCCRTEFTPLLAHTLYLAAKLMDLLQNTNIAAFLYIQVFKITNNLKDEMNRLKMNSLIHLAKISKDSQSEASIVILKKALQYSWYIRDMNAEQEIYEDLGMAHFYLGNMEQSNLFHQKAARGFYEPDSSSIRMLSDEFMKARPRIGENHMIGTLAHPRKITQGLLNQTDIHFIVINNDQFQFENSDLKAQSNIKLNNNFRSSVYNFKRNKINLQIRTQHEDYKHRGLKSISQPLSTMLAQMLEDEEFKFITDDPKPQQIPNFNRDKLKFNSNVRIKKESVKVSKELLMCSVDEKIERRKEPSEYNNQHSIKRMKSQINEQLRYKLSYTHLSLHREKGQLQKGVVLEDLLPKIKKQFDNYLNIIQQL